MSISGSIGAFAATVLFLPSIRKGKTRSEEITDADWENEVRILELERAARKAKPKPVSHETEVRNACERLAKTVESSTEVRKQTQEECLQWIRDFHRKTGELPSWTKVRTTLKLSNGTAHRYRNKIKAEVEVEPQKKAA